MSSFPLTGQMYEITVNLGKDGRQALRQLEFVWDYNHPRRDISKLRDCVNLQRLHIGLSCSIVDDPIHSERDMWEWDQQGDRIWKLLRRLPHDLQLKIRKVERYQRQICPFFEDDQHRPRHQAVCFMYHSWLSKLEKFEAELKENLRRRREGLRRVRRPRPIAPDPKSVVQLITKPKTFRMGWPAWEVCVRRYAAVRGEIKRHAA